MPDSYSDPVLVIYKLHIKLQTSDITISNFEYNVFEVRI